MKTLTLTAAVLALCASCVAADKKAAAVAPKPAPAAVAAKERQARQRVAMDLRRVADKLSADEVKAVQAIVAKHTAPVTKSAPAKKK